MGGVDSYKCVITQRFRTSVTYSHRCVIFIERELTLSNYINIRRYESDGLSKYLIEIEDLVQEPNFAITKSRYLLFFCKFS